MTICTNHDPNTGPGSDWCPNCGEYEPIRKPTPRAKRRGHKDPVTPETYLYVLGRDGGCIGPRMGMDYACDGRIEVDHLYNGGIGRRGPSTARNLSSLCQRHHAIKTNDARTWRPVINAYLEGAEGPAS